MKYLKILLVVFGVLAVVVVAGVAMVAANFDPNQYKPELAALVKEKTGRTLTIEGPLSLSVFPKLGVATGKVRLSEPGSTKVFASLAEARVSLELLPLMSQRIVVDRIVLRGLSADFVRGRDGRLNTDDLTDKPVPESGKSAGKSPPKGKADGRNESATPFKLDIDGVDIQADSLGWRDERDGTQLRLSGLTLKTGKIADNAAGKLELNARVEGVKPKINLVLAASTGYKFNAEAKFFALSDLSAKFEGDVPGAAGLKATLKGDIESDPGKGLLRLSGVELSAVTKDGIDARLSVPKLSISNESAQSTSITGTIKIKREGTSLDAKLALAELSAGPGGGARKVVSFPKLDVEFAGKGSDLKLDGRLATPISVNLEAKTVALPKLAGELTASGNSIPQKSMRVALDGQASADWGKEIASGNFTAKLDESTIQTRVGVTGFTAPAVSFDTAIDRLNLDRYRGSQKSAGGAGGSSAGGGSGSAASEPTIDLSGLANLNLNGQARVGQLTASGVKIEKLQANVRAAGGRLDVNPISAGLYGGTLAGSASAQSSKGNHFSLKQQLTGVNIGPLLRDLADKDMLEGRGNVALDLQTGGASVAALKRGLSGTASLQMKDGAIKGINLAESFRKAKALLGAKTQEQAANKADKTDFTDLSASFVIRGGIARNDDLAAKSPFLRLGGAGTIDIGASQVDYLAKVNIVNTSGGQGAKELNELRGLTVPVRLTGPFDALKYRIDFAAVASEAVKQQVQEAVKEKFQDKLQDRLKGLFKR